MCRGALDLVLPPACAGCGRDPEPDRALCRSCRARFDWIPEGLCELCEELPPVRGERRCGACALSPAPLVAVVAAVRFSRDAPAWIHRFKYPRRGLRALDPAADSVCVDLIRVAARRAGPAPDLVVPVPLHRHRLRSRAFNPANTLARSLAREVGASLDSTALLRIRDTRSQTGLDRRERRRNVRRAFTARRRFDAPERIWLVDDVATTTSTLAECAGVLVAAGAREITGITAARASTAHSLP